MARCREGLGEDAEELLSQLKELASSASSLEGAGAAQRQQHLLAALQRRVRRLQADAESGERQLNLLAEERDQLRVALREAQAASTQAAAIAKVAQSASKEANASRRKLQKAAEQAAAAERAAQQQLAQLTADLQEARGALERKHQDATVLAAAEREALQLQFEAMQSEVDAARALEKAAASQVAAAVEAKEAAEHSRQDAERARRQAELDAATAVSLAEAERQQRADAEGLRWVSVHGVHASTCSEAAPATNTVTCFDMQRDA